MASITQNYNGEQELNDSISAFLKTFKVIPLLKACCRKEKGIDIESIFRYLLELVFADRSMYMQEHTKQYKENFSTKAVYRFLNDARTHWDKLTTQLSATIINDAIRPLTNEDRCDCFVIDDSPIMKRGFEHTQLVANVWNHVDMKYMKGYRMLTLGWTDFASYFPIMERLLSSKEDKNIVGIKPDIDKRTLSGKRALQACRKGTDVMVEMLKYAISLGHKAKYVLFDTWFANPVNIMQIKNECNLDVICMLKKSKTYYEFEGQKLNVKEIFKKNKKRPGRSKYLLSVEVNLLKNHNGKTVSRMPARIVYVRNRNNRKEWIAILTTDIEISPEEIIRNYGKRWNCEVFFKASKQLLKLEKCQSLTYDAHTAHISMVFIQYMLISYQKRMDNDERSFGEIVYMFVDELADISFVESLQLIIEALFSAIMDYLKLNDEVFQPLFDVFYAKLPPYIRSALKYTNFSPSEGIA